MKRLREISAECIMEHVEKIVDFGPRIDGSPSNLKAAEYISKYLESLKYKVNKLSLNFPYVENAKSNLKLLKNDGVEEFSSLPNGRSALTKNGPIKAEGIFVDTGLEKDYIGKNIKGKIVFAAEEKYWQGNNMVPTKYWRAVNQEAVAFVFSDKRNDDAITCWGISKDLSLIPSINISYNSYLSLKNLAKKETLNFSLSVTGKITDSIDYIVSATKFNSHADSKVIFIDGSHRETVAFNPGANDNASGNAIMLEMARFFSIFPSDHTLVFISTCGEECGCHGTKKFIQENDDLIKKGKAAFVIDQVAGGNPGIIKQGIKYAGESMSPTNKFYFSSEDLTKELCTTAKELGYLLPIYDEPGGGFGEAADFIESGIPSIFLCGWNTDIAYHTYLDNLDKINANGLKSIADIVTGTILKMK